MSGVAPQPPGFTGDQATFVGFALEGLFHGAYTIIFASALYVLLQPAWSSRGAFKHVNQPMLWTTVLLFCLCTIHWWLEFENAYVRLMVHPGGTLSDENNVLRAADTIFSVTDFFAQLILVRSQAAFLHKERPNFSGRSTGVGSCGIAVLW
jgi:hypothetical protein